MYKKRARNIALNLWHSFLHLAHWQPTGDNLDAIKHIIFVCKGNICRSAFAEHYSKIFAHDLDLTVNSCGLDVSRKVCSPLEAVKAAEEFHVDLRENYAKGISACDVSDADLLVAMDFGLYRRLIKRFPEKKNNIVLLRSFAPWPEFLLCDIADPYGGDVQEFKYCFRTMKRALDVLHDRLRRARS